jgi:hypothetical protein
MSAKTIEADEAFQTYGNAQVEVECLMVEERTLQAALEADDGDWTAERTERLRQLDDTRIALHAAEAAMQEAYHDFEAAQAAALEDYSKPAITCPGCSQPNYEADEEGAVDGPREYHASCWMALSADAQRTVWAQLAAAGRTE